MPPNATFDAAGHPVGPWREHLRHISNARNVVTVALAWTQIVVTVAGVVALHRWWVTVVGAMVMGRAFALLSILAHEAAHRLLFTSRRWNDGVGRWLLAYPAFVPFDAYRRSHMAHHRDELGPAEPDARLYAGYPISGRSAWRKVRRDALGVSGLKNLRGLLVALGRRSSRPVALRILGVQAVLVALTVIVEHPGAYLWLWLVPWLTSWRVLNRLRAVAEHGGMTASEDKRRTTHVVTQHVAARVFVVPYRTGWHLAHHLDAGVPWRNLPRLHDALVRLGYVTEAITYPSYTALWRAAVSGSRR
jgi:fatty acid desaturase